MSRGQQKSCGRHGTDAAFRALLVSKLKARAVFYDSLESVVTGLAQPLVAQSNGPGLVKKMAVHIYATESKKPEDEAIPVVNVWTIVKPVPWFSDRAGCLG